MKNKTINTKANTTINNTKEDKEMSNNNTKNTNVNAKVNETKEEKDMTNAKTMTIAELKAQAKAGLEAQYEGVSFEIGAQAAERFANYNNLGMHKVAINSIEFIDVKYDGNPDKGTRTHFMKALKITLDDSEGDYPPIIINYTMFLFNKAGRDEDTDVYDCVVNGAGTKGIYFTVKEDALEKKLDELTAEDLEIHKLGDNERIWIPGKKELAALAKSLGLAEIEFNEDNMAVIPANVKIPVYVYEDSVMTEVMKSQKGELKKFAKFEYFYNVSFIAPEDQYDMKYGRRFTTSKSASRREEIEQLPGVVRYLESC